MYRVRVYGAIYERNGFVSSFSNTTDCNQNGIRSHSLATTSWNPFQHAPRILATDSDIIRSSDSDSITGGRSVNRCNAFMSCSANFLSHLLYWSHGVFVTRDVLSQTVLISCWCSVSCSLATRIKSCNNCAVKLVVSNVPDSCTAKYLLLIPHCINSHTVYHALGRMFEPSSLSISLRPWLSRHEPPCNALSLTSMYPELYRSPHIDISTHLQY